MRNWDGVIDPVHHVISKRAKKHAHTILDTHWLVTDDEVSAIINNFLFSFPVWIKLSWTASGAGVEYQLIRPLIYEVHQFSDRKREKESKNKGKPSISLNYKITFGQNSAKTTFPFLL